MKFFKILLSIKSDKYSHEDLGPCVLSMTKVRLQLHTDEMGVHTEE